MKTPQIIGIITPEVIDQPSLQEELMLCDRLEIRYDLFLDYQKESNIHSQTLIDLTRKIETLFIGKTYIATLRLIQDGGKYPSELENLRVSLFRDLLKECRSIYWVDVEIEQPQTALALQDLCELEDIEMIRSHHNFKASYPIEQLRKLTQQIKIQKTASIKLALSPQNENEENAIYTIIQEESKHLIAAFGMGPIGKRSRILSPLLGAPFTYAYVGEKPSAPGQWRARDLRQILENAPQGQDLEKLKEWYNLFINQNAR